MPQFPIDNFSGGLRRDAAVSPAASRLFYLQSLVNYEIDPITGHLRKRRGSELWNDELDGIQQVHRFTDLAGNQHTLVVSDNKLFVLENESYYTIHDFLSVGGDRLIANDNSIFIDNSRTLDYDEVLLDGLTSHDMSEPPYVFLNVDNRVLFSDQDGWYFTSSKSLNKDSPVSLSAIIEKPDSASFESMEFVGHAGSTTGIVKANTKYIAQPFQLEYDQVVDSVVLALRHYVSDEPASPELLGSMRLIIVANDSNNEPSIEGDTLLEATEGSASQWMPVSNLSLSRDPNAIEAGERVAFIFGDHYLLSKDVTYHLVVEFDKGYIDSYDIDERFVGIDADLDATYVEGPVRIRRDTDSDWHLFGPVDLTFLVGGGTTANLTDNLLGESSEGEPSFYGEDLKNNLYRFTYYNSDHGIESKPSTVFTFEKPILRNYSIITVGDTDNPVVDKFRVYKARAVKETVNNRTTREPGEEYVLIGEFNISDRTIVDGTNTDNLGLKLQTDNDIEQLGLQVLIATMFKNRLFVFPISFLDDIAVYYSYKLEDIGALGRTGDSIIDVFPASNRFEITGLGPVRAMETLSIPTDQGQDEMLVIYFDNSVATFRGFNTPLNPVALTDLRFNVVLNDTGIVGPGAVTSLLKYHVFLSDSGLILFNGGGTTTNLSNGYIDSILDSISGANLSKTIIRSGRSGIWMLIDENDDGELDTFYQLNMREITEEGIAKEVPEWKSKKYDWDGGDIQSDIRDFIIDGDDILAVFDDGRIYRLETDTGADSNSSVTGLIRTHRVTREHDERRQYVQSPVERPLFFHEVYLTARYPDGVPTYTVIVRDKDENKISVNLSPTSQNDKRSHRARFRLRSEEADFEIQQRSMERDEIRELTIRWE